MSTEFMRLSEQQKAKRKKIKHPHRLARKGYAGLAEEIAHELCDDDEINRAILYKRARMNKKGEFDKKDKKLKEIMRRIDQYIDERKQGKLKITGPNDGIIPRALESKEAIGRVMGVGGYVTPTTYFNNPRGKTNPDFTLFNEQQKELMETKKKVSKQDERITKLEAQIAKLGCSNKVQCPTNEDEVKLDKDFDDVQILTSDDVAMQGDPVGLKLESSNVFAAYGTIVPVGGKKLHSAPFPKNCMRVSIDEVINRSAPLPIPISGECERLSDAVGTFVAWPKHLVVLKKEPKNKRKRTTPCAPKGRPNVPKSVKILLCYANAALKDSTIQIPLDYDVFGVDCAIHVHLEDIKYVYDLKPVTANCITVYMWHLFRKMKEEGIQDKFCFMNPNVIAFFRDKNEEDSQKFERLNEMARFVAKRLITSSPNQLVLMPSNVGYHWILTVVDHFNEHVFLMDAMSHKIRSSDWKYIVNTALAMFKEEKGMQGKKKATWEVVPGPRQPDEVQCGFYVMRFMREITGGAETIYRDSLRSIFKQVEYSIAEIDEVRREWADCVQDFVYDD